MATIAQPRTNGIATVIVLLLGLAILLNYIDRGAIAIAAPRLKPELGLSATQFGLAVSAFFWIYAPVQYVIGWACDRWCVYRLLAAGIALWAVSTMLMGLVGSLAALVILRLMLGLGESITFPGASKVIARHVEPRNRGMANSVVGMGIALGPVVGTLAGGMIVAYQGWRPMFVIFGGLTLLWVIPWLSVARRLPSFSDRSGEGRLPVARLLRKWPLWAMGIAHFCPTYTLYFVVTWVPLYLVQSRGFTIQHMTWLATLGFLAQAVAAFLTGWTSDWWTRSGRDEARCRRWMMIAASLLAAAGVIGLMTAGTSTGIAFWLMALGVSSAIPGVNLYAVAQMFAGPRASGSFIGIQNATGNMSGIIMPVVTGAIIDLTGVYDNAFILTAVVSLAGALWWAFGVPKIKQVALD
jgi:MFS family permease